MKILYSGPITPAGQPSTGGFEAANRKNIDALPNISATKPQSMPLSRSNQNHNF